MKPPRRARERGLSVLEALIVTAITAILVMLLLPLAPAGMRRDYGLAEATLAAGAAIRGEAGFQNALRAIVQPPGVREAGVVESVIQGDRYGLAGMFAAARDSACSRAGAGGVVSLRIERAGAGGRLVCRGEAGDAELLAWAEGEARFAYSANGAVWREAWPAREVARAAPGVTAPSRSVLVRFVLDSRATGRTEWLGRAGFTEPVEVRAPPAEAAAT